MPSYMARKLGRTDEQECSSDENESAVSTGPVSDRRSLSRRSYITLGASVAAVLQSPTITAARTPSTERSGIEFQAVLDAVEDLGMDPTGQKPVDSILADAGDGVLIQFPDGTYRFDADAGGVELTDTTRGFEGVGDDVSFVTPEGYRRFSLSCEQMDGLYLAGIDIDQTAPDAYTGLRLCGNRVVVRDLELLGASDVRSGGCPVISHATLTPDGTSRFENVVATAGNPVRPVLGRPGIFIEQSHAGTVRLRDCDLREFPDAAVHAARQKGTVAVLDSYFENNAASIRLSGAGSSIEGCDIVVDETPAAVSPGGAGQQFRRHGIAVVGSLTSNEGLPGATSSGGRSTEPVTITDTSIRIEDRPSAGPALVVPSSGSPVDLRGCDIEYNNDDSAVILCRTPGEQSNAHVRPLRVYETTIAGSGAVDAAIVGNPGDVRLRRSTVRLPKDADEIRYP